MEQHISTKDFLFVGLAFLIAAVISALITPLVKKFAVTVGAVDVPKDKRRMHHKPIPRLGGLAIFIAFSVSVIVLHSIYDKMVVETPYFGIAIGSLMIVILGIVDDIHALPAIPKFLVQLLAAGVAAYFGCRISRISNPIITSDATYLELPTWLSFGVSVIWIVAITNAVNFIDGLDGLASGISAISAGSLMVIAALTGNIAVAIIMAALMGGCLGFLPYNFNPAKIFMGDTGATFLGFMLATMSVQGMFKLYAFVSFAVPILILGVPIFDICFAFLRRVAKGQNPMTADRGHIHHRLIDLGFTQRQAVAIAYMMTAILGLTAIVLTLDGEMQALLLIAAFILAGAVGIIIIMRNKFEEEPSQEKKDDKQD